MHAVEGTIGHPSTNPTTDFSVVVTFRIQEAAYDQEVERPSIQEQADEMAGAVVDVIREALGQQSLDLLQEIEVGARGVVPT